MPRRNKNGQAIKKEREGVRPAVEAFPDGAKDPNPLQGGDRSCNHQITDEVIPHPTAYSPSDETTPPSEISEIEHLKNLVVGLEQKIAEMGKKISALETQLRPSASQTKKESCQSCQTEFVRMNVYVHGKKILLEYCPKCVSDPLLIMKE